MVDEIKLKLMKKKPTLDDIAKPEMSADAGVVFRVAVKRSCKEQTQLLRKAANL